MPAYGQQLSKTEINNLVAYLKAMQSVKLTVPEKVHTKAETLDYTLKVEHWVDEKAGLRIPWAIDFINKDKALVTERPGRLRVIENGILNSKPIEDTPEVLHEGQGGLMDVAVDPEYASNGWIYLGYSHALTKGKRAPAMTRIVRGRIVNHKWTDQQGLFEASHDTYRTTRHHYGTRIVFDPQGRLYFAIGDRGTGKHAQDLMRPNGKVHRINRDGSIPKDNPFVGQKNALPSIYSYGHRNPQGLSIHPTSGQLWDVEHGPRGGDEANICLPGRNYGWPVITYGINYNGTVITEQRRHEGMEQPNYYWRPSIAVCGADFYTGSMFPYWRNHLLVATLRQREVRLLDIEGDRVMHEEIILKDVGRVREAIGGPDGAIYVVVNEPHEILRVSLLAEKTRKR
jgi:aldose sugar dehydrogenase